MMDELAMTAGLIPVRHAALPGVVKLPRRYEKAALGDPRTARYRKVSICSNMVIGEGVGARLDDLMTAIMWVKQELILLRQHDILLKRQFFDIHHSITSLQSRKSPASYPVTAQPLFTLSDRASSSRSVTPDSDVFHTPLSSPILSTRKRSSSNVLSPSSDTGQGMDTDCLEGLFVRPSASVTVLSQVAGKDDDDYDTDGDDTFDEDFFRPRTSSMRTSRDLAALARRRGSKELI